MTKLTAVTITPEDPNWVGTDHQGGFYATPMSVSETELALPDEKWAMLRDLYVDGLTRDAHAAIGAWFDQQRSDALS